MHLPEEVLAAGEEELVVGVALYRQLEGREARLHDEEDDAESEHVGHDWLVVDISEDLGGEVASCSNRLWTEASACIATQIAGESKVNDLEFEISIEDQVFQL